jgi:hypothetical protein
MGHYQPPEDDLPAIPSLRRANTFDASELGSRPRASSQETQVRKLNTIGYPASNNLIPKEKQSPSQHTPYHTPGILPRNSPQIFNRSPSMNFPDSQVNSRLGSPGRGDIFRREPSPVLSQGRTRGSSSTPSTSHGNFKKLSEMLKEETKASPSTSKPRSKTFGLEHDYNHYLHTLVKEEFDKFQLYNELTPTLISIYIKWIEQQANLTKDYRIFAFPTDFLHSLVGQDLFYALNSIVYFFREQKKNYNIDYERYYYFFLSKEQKIVLFEVDPDEEKITIYYPREFRMTEDQLDDTLLLIKKRLNELFNMIYKGENKKYQVEIMTDLPTGRDLHSAQLFALEYFKNRAFDRDPRAMTFRSIAQTKETILNVLKKHFKVQSLEKGGM